MILIYDVIENECCRWLFFNAVSDSETDSDIQREAGGTAETSDGSTTDTAESSTGPAATITNSVSAAVIQLATVHATTARRAEKASSGATGKNKKPL